MNLILFSVHSLYVQVSSFHYTYCRGKKRPLLGKTEIVRSQQIDLFPLKEQGRHCSLFCFVAANGIRYLIP